MEPNQFAIALGRSLRAAREQAGLTQSALARSVGVADSAIYRYEVGTHLMRLDVFASACNALGVTADAILASALRDEVGAA